MQRPTLAHVRSSAFPEAIGECADNLSKIASIVNECQERLLHDPLAPDEGWYGGHAMMLFNVSQSNHAAYITTPREVARVIAFNVCDQPMRLRNGFYEYLEFGIGTQPNACGNNCGCQRQAYERDNAVTLASFLATPQKLRFYISDAADVGKRIVVQGTDQNGVMVLGLDSVTQQSVLGETVYLNMPFSDTVNTFATLTGFLKDVLLGPMQMFQVDPVTGTQVALSSMEPQETTAAYRRYLLNGLPANCCNAASSGLQVKAQVKLDLVPVVSDQDYLLIQSIPALIQEAMCRRYEMNDTEKAAKLAERHHLKAIQLLDGQLDHVLGKTSTAIRVSLFGSDRLRLQPR